MGWKTPFLMIKKGNFFGVQAISATIFRRESYLWQGLRRTGNCSAGRKRLLSEILKMGII